MNNPLPGACREKLNLMPHPEFDSNYINLDERLERKYVASMTNTIKAKRNNSTSPNVVPVSCRKLGAPNQSFEMGQNSFSGGLMKSPTRVWEARAAK